jgi:hypothetical protein
MPCRLKDVADPSAWNTTRKRLEKVGQTSDYQLTPDSLENWLWVPGLWCTQPTRHASREARIMRGNRFMVRTRKRAWVRVIGRSDPSTWDVADVCAWLDEWRPSVGISYADWPDAAITRLLADVQRPGWRPRSFRRGWVTSVWAPNTKAMHATRGWRAIKRQLRLSFGWWNDLAARLAWWHDFTSIRTPKGEKMTTKEEKVSTVKVDKFPTVLWKQGRAAALAAGQEWRDWLAEAIREKLERKGGTS